MVERECFIFGSCEIKVVDMVMISNDEGVVVKIVNFELKEWCEIFVVSRKDFWYNYFK